jgi:hypothetical protein
MALTQLLPSAALGGLKVFESEDMSLELGTRMQPRLELERAPVAGGGTRWQRDFLVRRARFKMDGKVLDAVYKFEWKIDGTDQINASPSAAVENAYIQLPLVAGAWVRAGLYDQPFSRDRLTSDSRQLAVDRGAVSNTPDKAGLVDNAVGFHVLGKVRGGRAEYALGLFDNRTISGELQDVPMVVGRLDFNLGSTKDVYQDCHFGTDAWYSFGLNGSYQGRLENAAGDDDGSRAALGVDAMVDVPAGPTRVFLRGEASGFSLEPATGGNTLDTSEWMLGAGLLFFERLQPFARFDQVRLDDAVGGGTQNLTYVGANFYRKGHSLKFQGDVRFESGTDQPVDGARLQAQVDF